MVLITVAGRKSAATAIGVGGFLVILGIAFFVNSRLGKCPERPARRPIASRPSDSIPT